MIGCKKNQQEKIDYSKYSFTDVSWTRDSGYDIETITTIKVVNYTDTNLELDFNEEIRSFDIK